MCKRELAIRRFVSGFHKGFEFLLFLQVLTYNSNDLSHFFLTKRHRF